jgi:hypothetical protein
MVPYRYMSDSRQSKKADTGTEPPSTLLNLPNGSSFVSQRVNVDIKEIIALSERLLPISNSRPDFIERKKSSAIPVRFVL